MVKRPLDDDVPVVSVTAPLIEESLPVKRPRGRPRGSKNKSNVNALVVGTSNLQATPGGTLSSSSHVLPVRKLPTRTLKGIGGDLARKQQISKSIDPYELKRQSDALSAAKSPIPSSAPLNPYAPAALKPATKKKKTVVAVAPTQMLPVVVSSMASATALVSNLPAISKKPGFAIQGHKYPSYTLPASDLTENGVSEVAAGPGIGGFAIAVENPILTDKVAGLAQIAGLSSTEYQTMIGSTFCNANPTVSRPDFPMLETSSGSESVMMTTGAMQTAGLLTLAGRDTATTGIRTSTDFMKDSAPTLPTLLAASAEAPMFAPGLSELSGSISPIVTSYGSETFAQELVPPPTLLRYGFQPSPTDEATQMAENIIMEASTESSSETSPLQFDFNLDVGMTSFSQSADYSTSGSSVGGASDDRGYYGPGNELSWSQDPLDSVYLGPNTNALGDTPSTYLFPKEIEQRIPNSQETTVVQEPMDSQMSNRLQDELFQIDDEDAEGETDESSSESDSDIGEADDETEVNLGDLHEASTYVASPMPPRSRPYSGAIHSSDGVASSSSQTDSLGPRSDFVGSVPASYQSTDSYSITNMKRKRKPRSDCTAALLQYGSIQLDTHSPSPAPSVSNRSSLRGFRTMLATPELTPAPSLEYEDVEQERIDVDEIVTNEDRAFYSGVRLMAYDLARDLSRLRLALENAFPECPKLFKEEPEITLQDILVDCVEQAIAHFGLENDEVMQKNKYHIALGISKDRSSFRGDLKTCARKAVATVLKVEKEKRKKKGTAKTSKDDEPVSPATQKHRSEVINLVKDWFKDDKYLLGGRDEYGNFINYGSQLIQKVINDFFYGHEQKLAFLFEDYFKHEVPKRVVALVASAIQCALMEYEKHGYLKTLRFDPKDFAKRYRRHVRGIQALEEVRGHRLLFRKERKRWAKAYWNKTTTTDENGIMEHEDDPPVHLRLEFYLPPGAELSDSEEEN